MSSLIQNQIRLPFTVALEVVLQGIRIRLGRSLVTLTGIVLGIAFLMSILTSQSLRNGVREETDRRAELQRMANFLEAETGPVSGKTLGVIQVGPLNEVEARFVGQLGTAGMADLRWSGAMSEGSRGGAKPPAKAAPTDLMSVGSSASAVLVIGEGGVPAVEWPRLLLGARQKVVATTRKSHFVPAGEGYSVVLLERQLRPDEIEEKDAQRRKNRFRTIWIIVISLLVTVIGISNAMLMSVTERFREIGTMKCLGALSYFIRQQFFLESSIMGLSGSVLGSLLGSLLTVVTFGATYGMDLVLSSLAWGPLFGYGLFCTVAGVILSIVAAIYPAHFASRMVPATALRSNV